MADFGDKPHPIEAALLELETAEKACLFSRTRVDAKALLAAEKAAPPPRLHWLARRTVFPVAASVALVVGASAWVFHAQPGLSPDAVRVPSSLVAVADASPCERWFPDCLTGPGAIESAPCRTFDYDADGDVDLHDFGTHQRSCPGSSR